MTGAWTAAYIAIFVYSVFEVENIKLWLSIHAVLCCKISIDFFQLTLWFQQQDVHVTLLIQVCLAEFLSIVQND